MLVLSRVFGVHDGSEAFEGAKWLRILVGVVAAASSLARLGHLDGFVDARLVFLGVEFSDFALRDHCCLLSVAIKGPECSEYGELEEATYWA